MSKLCHSERNTKCEVEESNIDPSIALRFTQDDKINRTLVQDEVSSFVQTLVSSSGTSCHLLQQEKAWKTIISSADMEIHANP